MDILRERLQHIANKENVTCSDEVYCRWPAVLSVCLLAAQDLVMVPVEPPNKENVTCSDEVYCRTSDKGPSK